VRNVVIAAGARTPIGKFNGSLAGIPAVDLGTHVVREALKRAGVAPTEVNEVIMGHVVQAGTGSNTARQVLIKAGIPTSVPACTVNKVCASGMKAVTLGALSIAAGEQEVVVAGGMESMNSAPYLLQKARWGYRLGDEQLVDSLLRDALQDPMDLGHMGMTAENLAAEFRISRRDQDEFATESHRRAAEAIRAGRFSSEIVPVEIPQKKGPPQLFSTDEGPRPDTTVEVLTKLKPAFKPDGTVTAGNSSSINDGAAALVLLSADEARRRGIKPLARIRSWASAGVEPSRMGYGPVPAVRAALAKSGLTLSDMGAIELNEAFAAQSLAVIRELKLDIARTNMNGGAIALGHPVGASGARIIVTLLHTMTAKDLRYGLATLCVGGGQGMAIVVER